MEGNDPAEAAVSDTHRSDVANGMSRLDYLLKLYDNLLGWYRQAEEKAKFLVTVNTFAVGVVNGLVFFGADRISPVVRTHAALIWTILALCGATLIGSYVFVLGAVWPRHHWLDVKLKPSQRMWFFGDINAMSMDEFAAGVHEWSDSSLEETMIAQTHILSRSVWRKHEALNWAIALTICSLVSLLGLGVAFAIAVATPPR